MKTYKELIVWQKAINLVSTIYNNTKSFPKEEIYGLTNQIRRAAVSIPSNTCRPSLLHNANSVKHNLRG